MPDAGAPAGDTARETAEVIERFWAKVDASGDCWQWTAATARGYGYFSATNRRNTMAHRKWRRCRQCRLESNRRYEAKRSAQRHA